MGNEKLLLRCRQGFTLIEISIVLVVIGLIVGGILVGQDLIKAAGINAQISQIEKYNTAVNTFRLKYGYLPGDIPNAAQFGFVVRAATSGKGDGNGAIQSYCNDGFNYGWSQTEEALLFWEDLSSARLINEGFTAYTEAYSSATTQSSSPNFDSFLPKAKIGQGNYVYVWNTTTTDSSVGASVDDNNYFGISNPTNITSGGNMSSSPALSVKQAYAIDKKIDDGFPTKGKVVASMFVNGNQPGVNTDSQSPNAATDTANTCYNTTNNTYSTPLQSSNLNCALSIKFQ